MSIATLHDHSSPPSSSHRPQRDRRPREGAGRERLRAVRPAARRQQNQVEGSTLAGSTAGSRVRCRPSCRPGCPCRPWTGRSSTTPTSTTPPPRLRSSPSRRRSTPHRTYSSVHRGKGFASQVTSRWYEQAREEVARFVGAREGDHVVFTRNTTDSLNLLARALPRDYGVRLRERAPRGPPAVEPQAHGAPAGPGQRPRRRDPAGVGAGLRPRPAPPRRAVGGVERHRRAVARGRPRGGPAPRRPRRPRRRPARRRTAPSTSGPWGSTTWPSRATSSTRRSAPGCWPGAGTGSTAPPLPRRRRATRTVASAGATTDRPGSSRGGLPQRHRGDRPGRGVCGAGRTARGDRGPRAGSRRAAGGGTGRHRRGGEPVDLRPGPRAAARGCVH